MIVQAIPQFNSGRILRGKMLESLSEYTYQHTTLLYQACTDGIVSGCALTTTEDSIILNLGVVRYEGELYLLNKPQFLPYSATDTTRVLQLVFHDKVTTETFVTREIELCFTDGPSVDPRHMEMCRFKLQPKARLRYEYTDFADRETEYDTLNIIHSPFCGLGHPTLSPDIVRHFAQEALSSGASGLDATFCLQILSVREPIQRDALQGYIKLRLGQDTPCDTNIQIYHALLGCLAQMEQHSPNEKKPTRRKMLLVD